MEVSILFFVENIIFNYYGCFFVDDITVTADGVDTYHLVKKADRYKYAK